MVYCCKKFEQFYIEGKIKVYASGMIKFDDHNIFECPFCHRTFWQKYPDNEDDKIYISHNFGE